MLKQYLEELVYLVLLVIQGTPQLVKQAVKTLGFQATMNP